MVFYHGLDRFYRTGMDVIKYEGEYVQLGGKCNCSGEG